MVNGGSGEVGWVISIHLSPITIHSFLACKRTRCQIRVDWRQSLLGRIPMRFSESDLKSAFFNPRGLIGLAFCSVGLVLTLLAFALYQSGNALAQGPDQNQ